MRSVTGSGIEKPDRSGQVHISRPITTRRRTATGPRRAPSDEFVTGSTRVPTGRGASATKLVRIVRRQQDQPAAETPRRRPLSKRFFEVHRVAAESIVLVDDEWQAVSVPSRCFPCELRPGQTLVVPFQSDGSPVWARATVHGRLRANY